MPYSHFLPHHAWAKATCIVFSGKKIKLENPVFVFTPLTWNVEFGSPPFILSFTHSVHSSLSPQHGILCGPPASAGEGGGQGTGKVLLSSCLTSLDRQAPQTHTACPRPVGECCGFFIYYLSPNGPSCWGCYETWGMGLSGLISALRLETSYALEGTAGLEKAGGTHHSCLLPGRMPALTLPPSPLQCHLMTAVESQVRFFHPWWNKLYHSQEQQNSSSSGIWV